MTRGSYGYGSWRRLESPPDYPACPRCDAERDPDAELCADCEAKEAAASPERGATEVDSEVVTTGLRGEAVRKLLGMIGTLCACVEFSALCVRHYGIRRFVSWGIPHMWFTWRPYAETYTEAVPEFTR